MSMSMYLTCLVPSLHVHVTSIPILMKRKINHIFSGVTPTLDALVDNNKFLLGVAVRPKALLFMKSSMLWGGGMSKTDLTGISM